MATFALGLILGRLPRAVCGNFTYLPSRWGSFWEGCRGPFVATSRICSIYPLASHNLAEVAARPSWQLPFWRSFWIGCHTFVWFPSDFAQVFDWLVTIWLRLPRTLRGNLRVGAHFGKVAVVCVTCLLLLGRGSCRVDVGSFVLLRVSRC